MEPKLAGLLAQAEHQVDVCVAFALLWAAAAEGRLDANTQAYLNRHFEALPGSTENSEALQAILAANDADSVLLACRVLQRELKEEEKQFFLELAIGAAAVNSELSISANHILRLYADLLGFGLDQLGAMYHQQTGGDLPEPGDPSSVLWWEVREQRFADSAEQSGNYQYSPAKRFSRVEAYAALGLEQDAPPAEIKKAYRRLVQKHHPDRHVSLGPEAREIAEDNFLRVQHAYEVLSQ